MRVLPDCVQVAGGYSDAAASQQPRLRRNRPPACVRGHARTPATRVGPTALEAQRAPQSKEHQTTELRNSSSNVTQYFVSGPGALGMNGGYTHSIQVQVQQNGMRISTTTASTGKLARDHACTTQSVPHSTNNAFPTGPPLPPRGAQPIRQGRYPALPLTAARTTYPPPNRTCIGMPVPAPTTYLGTY